MRSTTLTTILLLTVAALVSCVILPPGLGQHIGLGRTCQNINAQAGTAYGLETTAALASARDTGTAVGDISPRDLSRRDPPGPYAPCGILRGNQHSAAFTLEPSNKWNAFWVDDRSVPGGVVILWELGSNDRHMLDWVQMYQRQLTPFKPEVDRQYQLELHVPGQLEQPIISWYFATQ